MSGDEGEGARTNVVSVITNSWIRIMAITVPTRLAVSSFKRCQAATVRCFTAIHDTTSTEVPGIARRDGASSSLRLRSV